MSIPFKDIVSMTGTPGLHQVVKADDRAIIIESIDERKHRQLVRGSMMVSKLSDVSIYTEDDSEPLVAVFKAIEEKYADELPVSKKSSKTELMDFLKAVLPSFDEEKVYPSNVKKLISWYKILRAASVEFVMEEEGEEAAETAESTEKTESAE
ncbi:MAG: DUF5606 domain-containing protein [Bacteroidota bacterium]